MVTQRQKDIFAVTLFIGILGAGGLLLKDASQRVDVLSANNGGIDVTYSIANAYGLDQTWTIIAVLFLGIGSAVFFLVVYPLLVGRPVDART